MAAAGVSIGSTLVKLGIAELTAHTQRLGDAKAENQAADECIPAFDADLKLCNSAYRTGQADKATVIAAFAQIKQNCLTYLSALVGKPGTAWSGSETAAAAGQVPCNKSCTVSCCIYYNDIYPALYGAKQFGNGTTGALSGINGVVATNPSVNASSGGNKYVSYVPEVYPPDDSAYGTFSRPSYTLNWTPPSPVVSAQSNVKDTVAQLTSATGTLAVAAPKTVVSQAIVAANSGPNPTGTGGVATGTVTATPSGNPVPVPSTPTSSPIIMLVLGLVLIGGAFAIFKR